MTWNVISKAWRRSASQCCPLPECLGVSMTTMRDVHTTQFTFGKGSTAFLQNSECVAWMDAHARNISVRSVGRELLCLQLPRGSWELGKPSCLPLQVADSHNARQTRSSLVKGSITSVLMDTRIGKARKVARKNEGSDSCWTKQTHLCECPLSLT